MKVQLYNCFILFLPPLGPRLGDLGMGLQPAGASECFDFRHQFVLSAGTKEFGILDFSQATAAASKLLIGLTPREMLYRRSMADLYWRLLKHMHQSKKNQENRSSFSRSVYTVDDTVYDIVWLCRVSVPRHHSTVWVQSARLLYFHHGSVQKQVWRSWW